MTTLYSQSLEEGVGGILVKYGGELRCSLRLRAEVQTYPSVLR